MKQFPKLNVDDQKLSLIQDNLSNALNPLLNLPLSDSNVIEDVNLVNGTNIIPHGLGRNLIGWFITRQKENELIYDEQDVNPLPDLNLFLNASGSVTISLVVF